MKNQNLTCTGRMNILMQMLDIVPSSQIPEPASDYTRAGWWRHVQHYAKTGSATQQLKGLHETCVTKLAEFMQGSAFLYDGESFTVENNRPLMFCNDGAGYHPLPDAPKRDTTQAGWRLHLEYYEKYKVATEQVQAAMRDGGWAKAKAFAAAPDGSTVTASKGGSHYYSMNFNVPHLNYTIHPKVVKREAVLYKRIYTSHDDGWLGCEPLPAAASTRASDTYLGTIVVREQFENDVLVSLDTQFLHKF